MKKLMQSHYFVGVVFLVLFLLTGVYMLQNFPELYTGREEIRMMFRATHIYIRMSVMVNLMAGNYLIGITSSRFLRLRALASILILLTPFIFFWAFVIEPPSYLIERPISFWGVIALFSGVMLHSLVNVIAAYQDRKNKT